MKTKIMVILIILFNMIVISTSSLAYTDIMKIGIRVADADPKGMIDLIENQSSVDDGTGKKYVTNRIELYISVARVVAISISIIMLTVLGIKYMMAAPTERANIKNQLVTYIIGAVLAFGAVEILNILMKTSQQAIK